MGFYRFPVAALLLAAGLLLPSGVRSDGPPAPKGMTQPQWEGIYDYRGTVNLRWFRVQGAVSYLVQRRVGEEGDFRELARVTNPLCDDLMVFPGQLVYYRIIPLDAQGTPGPPSEPRYIKVESSATEEPLSPRWSSSLQMKEGIALSWTHDQQKDVLAYNIYRRKGSADTYTLITSTQDSTFLDRDVTPRATYEYVITALFRTLQESENSEPFKVTFSPPTSSVRADRARKVLSLEEVITPTELLKTYGAREFGFLSPVDVDWWASKRFLYVSDSGTGLITVINDRDEVVMRLGGKGSAPWNFQNLLGICVDEAGFVYATDSYRGEIVIFKPDGSFHKRLRLLEQVKEYFGKEFNARFPAFRFGLVDLGVAADGALLVVDNPNGWVYVLDKVERLVRIIGEKGENPGQFHSPTFMRLDENSRFTLSDSLNSRLQVLTVMGAPERVVGEKGLGIGQFIRPKGVARDDRGFLFVADSFLNAIQVFDAQGGFVTVLGDEKGKLLDLGLPNGMAFLGDDRLAVTEKISRRVTVRRVLLKSKTLFISTPAERKK